MSKEKKVSTKLIIGIIGTAICLALLALPFEGLDQKGKLSLIIFVWAIVMWMTRAIPEYLTAIVSGALVIVVAKVDATTALSGFSSGGWWLIVWAMVLSAVVAKTGLGWRIAYWMIAKVGNTLKKLYAANSIINIVLSFIIPSGTARGALLSTLADSLCDSIGYKPGEFKGDHGLMLNSMFANTSSLVLVFTASGIPAIGMALVKEATGSTITWLGWLGAVCVPAMIALVVTPFIVYKMNPPTDKSKEIDVSIANDKHKEMGKMSKAERNCTILVVLTILAWSTEKLHGISSNWVPFFTIFLMFLPGLGIAKWKDVQGDVSWNSLIWLGFAMSLASSVNATGGFQWLVDNYIVELVSGMSQTTFLMVWCVVIIFLHPLFAGMNAMVAVLVPVSISLSQALGYNVYTIGLITTILVTVGGNFLPFNSAPNMIFIATGRYTVGHQLKTAIVLNIMNCIVWLIAILVWFPLIGLL